MSKNKKKVLFYNSSLSFGGTDVYMVNVIENINKEKFEFDVLIKNDFNNNEQMVERLRKNVSNIFYLGSKTIAQIVNAKKFFKRHKGEYDVFHINATSGAMGIFAYMAKKYGKINNIIFHSHMGGNDNKADVFDKIGIKLAKKYSTHLVACSDTASKFMFGENNKIPVRILNNSIDLSKFEFNINTREGYRKQFKLKDEFVLLNVGRLINLKNQIKIIKVFNAMQNFNKNTKLFIVGDGYLKESFQQKILEFGLQDKVFLLGERPDVDKIMQMADVFVMTSLFEGLPIVAVEAQSSGLPLVLSRKISDMTDITGNCKFISLEENDEEWAKQILEYKTFNRKKTNELIKQNKFDNESAMKEIEILYCTL